MDRIDKETLALKKLLLSIDRTTSKDDLVTAVQAALIYLLRLNEKNTKRSKEESEALQQQYENVLKLVEDDSDFQEMKRSVNGFIQGEFGKFADTLKKNQEVNEKKITDAVAFESKRLQKILEVQLEAITRRIEKRLSEVKDGKDGNDGRTPTTEELVKIIQPLIVQPKVPTKEDWLALITPLIPEPKKLTVEDIEGLDRFVRDRVPTRIGGASPAGQMKIHDLSSSTDGSTKIFNVPKSRTGFILSSDFPHALMENNGFTINASRNRITFTTDNAPSSGSQLLYVFTSMFNY